MTYSVTLRTPQSVLSPALWKLTTRTRVTVSGADAMLYTNRWFDVVPASVIQPLPLMPPVRVVLTVSKTSAARTTGNAAEPIGNACVGMVDAVGTRTAAGYFV